MDIVPIYLFSNTFEKNNCWKRSNGGGMTIRGRIITTTSSSSEDANFMLTGEDPTYYGSPILQTILDDLTNNYEDEKEGIVIKDGNFIGNLAGYRGTACLIKDIPEVYIASTTFKNNGPVLWGLRTQNTYYMEFIKPIIDAGGDPQYFCGVDEEDDDDVKFNDQEFLSLYDEDPTSTYIQL